MNRFWRHTVGWFFVVLGVIGCFLPILQGLLFMLIGFLVLAPEVPFIHRILLRLKEKYPEIFRRAEEMQEQLKAKFRRLSGP